MRRIHYVLAASAMLALTGGAALAGAGMGHDGGNRFGFLQAMDADKDGAVTRAEIEAASAARAAEIDADGNGSISAAELLAWHDAQRQKRMEQRLAAMDSDGDGTVSVAEYEAASNWRLARLDRDGDGKIERHELRRHGHRHDHRHEWRRDRAGAPIEEPAAD